MKKLAWNVNRDCYGSTGVPRKLSVTIYVARLKEMPEKDRTETLYRLFAEIEKECEPAVEVVTTQALKELEGR